MKVKVKVRKANTSSVGLSIGAAFMLARDIADQLDHFRVQAWKDDAEMPVHTWGSMAGDTVSEIGRHGAWGPAFTDGECDFIKVIDDDLNKVIETILVNG